MWLALLESPTGGEIHPFGGAQGENPAFHLLGSFAESHVLQCFLFDVFL